MPSSRGSSDPQTKPISPASSAFLPLSHCGSTLRKRRGPKEAEDFRVVTKLSVARRKECHHVFLLIPWVLKICTSRDAIRIVN